MSELFKVDTLTTYDVDPDGRRVRLHARDEAGQGGGLDLPFESIRALMMTLPVVQQKALYAQTRDRSLRVAYELGDWSLERCRDGRLLLSLATEDGFALCFRLDAASAGEIGLLLADAAEGLDEYAQADDDDGGQSPAADAMRGGQPPARRRLN